MLKIKLPKFIKKSIGSSPLNFFISTGSASAKWWNTGEKASYKKAYVYISDINQIIDHIAKLFSNVKISVEDLKTGEEILGTNIERVLKNPNPVTSQQEFLINAFTEHQIYGNQYTYAVVPAGFGDKITADNVELLYALPSEFTTPIPTGRLFGVKEKSQIVDRYELKIGSKNISFTADEVMHKKECKINYDVGNILEGDSKIGKLQFPVSTMDALYEADNVVTNNLGVMGIYTNDNVDDAGLQPLNGDQVKSLQSDFSGRYGMKFGKVQQIITNLKLKWQQTLPNVQTLRIDEKQKKYQASFCRAFGFPIDMFFGDSTFSNSDKADKIIYQNAVIPFAKDFFGKLNTWLKTDELGIRIKYSYDHIQVLQGDKKTESETFKNLSTTLTAQYKDGLITRNDILTALGKDKIKNPAFDKFYYELTPDEGGQSITSIGS